MRKITYLLVAGALLSLVLIQACSNDEPSNDKPLSKYSGEELFKALYFVQGEAAIHIQSLRPKAESYKMAAIANPEIKKSSEEFSTEIVAKINELDPTYFKKFKEQLSSKNYYSMEIALNNGLKMLKAAGYRSSYASMFQLGDEMIEKKVDFDADEIKSLDLSKKEDFEKLQKYLKEDYAINLRDSDYRSGAAVPIYALAFAWTIAVAVATAALVINAAVYATVYLGAELWGGMNSQMMQHTFGQSDMIVQEIARLL